jgi:hypothetical protein
MPEEWVPKDVVYGASDPMMRRLCEEGKPSDADDERAGDAASQ